MTHSLQFGPYAPPPVHVGDRVYCERRGWVTVKRWSDRGAIMWPLGVVTGVPSQGRASLILMGDLVRAVRSESAIAVAMHWRTTWRTVRVWRRALGVGRVTPGTQRLLAQLGNMDIARYHRAGNASSLQPSVRARRDTSHAVAMRAKPDISDIMRRVGQARNYGKQDS